ncbi:MAG: MATE family efflux transporter [Phycisphaeraceae bacterium]|nr:MAG: MATE family efflux transporter [Phycisphaeraceae bacterium]
MPAVGPVTSPGLSPEGRLRSGKLAGLSMNRAIWVLSWPVMLESFLNSLVGVTDTAIAARLPDGTAATDAIAGASYIMWFIGLIFMALGIGATALIARSVGRGRMAVANAVLGQTVTLGLVVGVATAVFIAFASRPVAGWLHMSGPAEGAFNSYMLVIAGGVPFATILFALIACARGAGDSISPLYAMMVRNAVNIAVSWALSGADVGGFSGPFDLGVTGIAIGTVAGDIAGAAVVVTMAVRGRWGIRILARRLRPHWHTMRRIVRLGVPNFLETLGMWVGNFLVILMVGWLGASRGGEGLLGTHMVAIRIEAFSFLAGFAMGAAAATLAGQYLGAGAPELARRAIFRCALIAAGVMFAFGFVFLFAPEWPTRMLSSQPIHLEYVPKLLIVCGFIQIPFGLAIVTRGAMRGAGDVRVVMTITWVCTYAIRIPLAYFFSGVDIPLPERFGIELMLPDQFGGDALLPVSYSPGVIENPSPIDGGLVGLWIGICLEHVIRCALFVARFVHGGWARVRV